MNARSYKADVGTPSKLWPLHVISIPLRCLVRRSNGARSCALVEADRGEVTGTTSLHFYSTHRGAASLDNVKFAAKQLEAQAVTIEPDGGKLIVVACRQTRERRYIHPHAHKYIVYVYLQ